MNLQEKVDHALKLISRAVKNYKCVVGVSWGKDSMATLHLALQIDPKISCFTIITPFTPRETLQYMERMRESWHLNLKIYQNDKPADKLPPDIQTINPERCCRIYKIQPCLDAIKDYECWISGLRATEGHTRTEFQEVEHYGDKLKLNPILGWTEREVWQYIATRQIPVHPWYAVGYRSIGCAPCTSIPDADEPERAGRWRGTSMWGGECGIHTYYKQRKINSVKTASNKTTIEFKNEAK